MSKSRSPVQSILKRVTFLVIEVLTIMASFFAVYEIMFSRRYVGTLEAELRFCDKGKVETEKRASFYAALGKNVGRFLFLDLRANGIDWPCPQDNSKSPAEARRKPDGSWDLIFPGLGTVREGNAILGSYSVLNSRQISENIFIDYVLDVAESGSFSATGIFYVKRTDGEGDRYYYLIPAPYSVETQRLQKCTAELRDKRGIGWLAAYVSGCLFIE